jgi:DNA invertase Pin-like site-specific DNA recombinase
MSKRLSKQKANEPTLIPAVAYVRKSTKGERADGSQKQEKSLAQQRTEITKLATGRFKILTWFEDEGISGWKRGAQRPDFQRMLDGVKDLGAEAIICDNIDRFSRATNDDVQEDVGALRKAGVGRIVTANGGDFDLNAGRRNDLSGIIMFAAAVWAAHDFSRNLGRRSALARRNTINEGKRPGGRIPYAWTADGKHSLKHGAPERVKVVGWIFDQFANKGQSLNWIADQLNHIKTIPAPMGKEWYVRTLKCLLANPVYVGEQVYGLKRNGQFYTTDDKGEVVELETANGTPGKVWRRTKAYQAMVSAATFTKAQRRLVANATGRTRRKRLHALSGLL